MLENFHSQKDLSHCQAWWMEFLSQFNAKIVYIKGHENSVADTLSHMPTDTDSSTAYASAWHPYDFCEDNDTLCIVASISLPTPQGPWETVKALLTCLTPPPSICTMLEITANNHFWTVSNLAILKMLGARHCHQLHSAWKTCIYVMSCGTLATDLSFHEQVTLGSCCSHLLTTPLATSASTKPIGPREWHTIGPTWEGI